MIVYNKQNKRAHRKEAVILARMIDLEALIGSGFPASVRQLRNVVRRQLLRFVASLPDHENALRKPDLPIKMGFTTPGRVYALPESQRHIAEISR